MLNTTVTPRASTRAKPPWSSPTPPKPPLTRPVAGHRVVHPRFGESVCRRTCATHGCAVLIRLRPPDRGDDRHAHHNRPSEGEPEGEAPLVLGHPAETLSQPGDRGPAGLRPRARPRC